ncbi:MAG: hypothetical protein WD645_04290, partial [Dehalococcoidia bacterium]
QGDEANTESKSGIADAVDFAFDYRGDVTVHTANGASITGYLYNRNPSAAPPFVELFETETGERIRLRYDEIEDIQFTGRDTASGQSYAAWKARRGQQG